MGALSVETASFYNCNRRSGTEEEGMIYIWIGWCGTYRGILCVLTGTIWVRNLQKAYKYSEHGAISSRVILPLALIVLYLGEDTVANNAFFFVLCPLFLLVTVLEHAMFRAWTACHFDRNQLYEYNKPLESIALVTGS